MAPDKAEQLMVENSVKLKGNADFGICWSKHDENLQPASTQSANKPPKFRRVELWNTSRQLPLLVRRVYHRPARPVFDVYLERCGLWGDTTPETEPEPDFSALVPLAVAKPTALADIGVTIPPQGKAAFVIVPSTKGEPGTLTKQWCVFQCCRFVRPTFWHPLPYRQVPNFALGRSQVEHTMMVTVRAAAFWLKPSSRNHTLALCRDSPNFIPAQAKAVLDMRPALHVLLRPSDRPESWPSDPELEALPPWDLTTTGPTNTSAPCNLLYTRGSNANAQFTQRLTALQGMAWSPTKWDKKRPLAYHTRLYVGYMERLLQMERRQMDHDIKTFDVYFQKLKRVQNAPKQMLVMELEVKGASENQPSIEMRNLVTLRPVVGPDTKGSFMPELRKRGFPIIEVRAEVLNRKQDTVRLMLPKHPPSGLNLSSAQFSEMMCEVHMHIRFCCALEGFDMMRRALLQWRLSKRRGQSAARLTRQRWQYLCPIEPADTASESKEHAPVQTAGVERWDWANDLNMQQREAVQSVVSQGPGSGTTAAPYLVTGPPGTGKTLVLIECVVQVYRRNKGMPRPRVLVVAPTNSAADVITSRLRPYCTTAKRASQPDSDLPVMMRVVSISTDAAYIRQDVQSYCHISGPNYIQYPPPALLRKVDVVICTCAAAGMLFPPGHIGRHIPKDHTFDYILVDEAAQAMEPEIIVPLTLARPGTKVLLCGDPQQLGPTVRSRQACSWGLDISMLERLRGLPFYLERKAGPTKLMSVAKKPMWTRLVRNYRSHIGLLRLPSQRFYGNEILSCAPPSVADSMLKWEGLAKAESDQKLLAAKFELASGPDPLLFFGVEGLQENQIDTPSFWNVAEAEKVADIVESLVTSKRVKCLATDIGVMAPFRQQVLHIRALLRERDFFSVRVGTVDDYQGQEEKIVIVSTVLSATTTSSKLSKLAWHPHIGLMNNPKRFNVATSRGKALAIFVGNPNVICKDDNWRALLELCVERGVYRGVACPSLGIVGKEVRTEDTEDILYTSLLGSGLESTMFPNDLAAAFTSDQPWRVMM